MSNKAETSINSVAGFLTAFLDTESFIVNQYPSSSSSPVKSLPATINAKIVTMQLGNTYMLLALLGVFILNATSDSRVVKAYLLALAIADIGHVGPTMWMMGWERVMDLRGWNAMAWGNIGATAFLFVIRVTYLLGLFGGDTAVGKAKIV